MCGIAGIFLDPVTGDPRRLMAVEDMAASLRHRGPDGDGVWMDEAAGVALSHRRLAIIDLTDAGRQPMQSHDGTLIMTFNGEVYNFTELRVELEALGHRFRGHSDTEVMLAAFESFGIEPALKRFAGMFALAVWDRKRRALHLARDRMGKKPLYIAVAKGLLLFASEPKAIRAFPGFSPSLDSGAAARFLGQGWIPEHQCIWEGVFKLPPGSLLTVHSSDLADGDVRALQNRAVTWWSLADVAKAAQANPASLTDGDLERELEHLLKTVVRERMIADVPLGAFLSGGIDSSVVVALMQAQSTRPIKTFTIGFAESGFDEAGHASKVARYLGTDHTEFRVTPREALDVIPDLPRVWDEPFADESQIPTLLLSRLARRHVTVAMSGDGGDECFGGYTRHVWSAQLAAILRAPLPLRRAAGGGLLRMSTPRSNGSGSRWQGTAAHSIFNRENALRVGRLLDAGSEQELYERLVGFLPASSALAGRGGLNKLPELRDTVSRFIYRDMTGYLPSDILVKLDRATMAAALEGRCPLLDHRLVEFSWRIPTAAKVRGRKGKWILRKVLRRHLPEALFERPKHGFNLPIGSWLTGPLRDWAQDLLDPSRGSRSGLLDAPHVDRCWQDHLGGTRDRSRELWAMLMFEAWFQASHAATSPFQPDQYPARARSARTMAKTGLEGAAAVDWTH